MVRQKQYDSRRLCGRWSLIVLTTIPMLMVTTTLATTMVVLPGERRKARCREKSGPYRTPASVPQDLELEVVLDEFKMKDPAELRRALGFTDATKNLIGGK